MIILASKSPRRRQLLEEAGIKFRCVPADIQENSDEKDPEIRVRDLALQKAAAVAASNPDVPVLGSDTLVYCKGEILGKPHDNSFKFVAGTVNQICKLVNHYDYFWKFSGLFLFTVERLNISDAGSCK